MLKPTRLKSVPVFAGLSKEELRRIAECAEEVDVEAGEQLLREAAYAFEFLVISSGAAEVVRDGDHVAHLGPGDVMGEIGALTHGQRIASVVATAPSRVIYIRAQDFRHFAEEMPELGRQIRRIVRERTWL